MKNVPFIRLCGATFLVFNGFQMVAAFSVYIIVFYLFNGSYESAGTWPAWFSSITAVVTAFLVIPLISWISNTVGKRNAFIISTAISIVGYLLKWWSFNPDNPWLMFMPIPMMAFGLGGLFTLMMSMTADVCDLDELNNGMPRKEGTFGAIYWWMVKLGQALALVMGGLVLKLVGFDGNAAQQTAETLLNLRIADIVIPASTAFLAILVISLSALVAHNKLANVDYRIGLLLGLGGIVGMALAVLTAWAIPAPFILRWVARELGLRLGPLVAPGCAALVAGLGAGWALVHFTGASDPARFGIMGVQLLVFAVVLMRCDREIFDLLADVIGAAAGWYYSREDQAIGDSHGAPGNP